MTARCESASPFGRQLRRWRAMRGLSQLELAAAAGTTPRHVSFVETGRSRPGRDLVLRIAEVLAVPLPERNALLAAAGLAPEFPEHKLGSAQLAAVDRVLAGHEPFPAWVVRQPFTFLRANTAATAVEITTSRLRVELMYPADEAAEAFFRARAAI
jgi:transcriptional regulator with XRE-family HTH domain